MCIECACVSWLFGILYSSDKTKLHRIAKQLLLFIHVSKFKFRNSSQVKLTTTMRTSSQVQVIWFLQSHAHTLQKLRRIQIVALLVTGSLIIIFVCCFGCCWFHFIQILERFLLCRCCKCVCVHCTVYSVLLYTHGQCVRAYF